MFKQEPLEFKFADFNLGNKYFAKKNYEKAAIYFKRQLNSIPHKEAWLNLGNCYRHLLQPKKAKECYLKVVDPGMPFYTGKYGEYDFGWSNLGLLNYAFQDDDEAVRCYHKALQANPDHYDSIWNLGLVLLRKYCSGDQDVDLEKAWSYYDFRFRKTNPVSIQGGFNKHWHGHEHGKSIVALAEQGMGDKFQWGRYLHLLRDYFEEVWVQCPNSMDPIFLKAGFKVKQFNIEDVEYSVPICDLSQRFGIHAGKPQWLQGLFGQREFAKNKLNILVEWGGAGGHANDHHRSTSAGYFTKLSKYANIYNCRPDAPKHKGIQHLQVKNWEDTAEIINGMDLVISIDTSLVHMAGSLGKPCLVLQPLCDTDFRWGRDCMGTNNIWYPSVKVIRNQFNWDKVFQEVEDYVKNLQR